MLPNAYLRCESRRPRSGFVLALWKYSLALVIVTSAALDALWLVPMQEAHDRAVASQGYRDAIHVRCHARPRHARVVPGAAENAMGAAHATPIPVTSR